MKPVSTGTGLVVLSATIAACFAASRFGGEERAFAQGESVGTPLTGQAAALNWNTIGPVGNCAPAVEAWFSPIPRAISYECRRVPRDSLFAADVNHDGLVDYFYSDATDSSLIQNGTPVPTPLDVLFHSRMAATGAGLIHTHINIFPSSAEVGASLRGQYPTLRQASLVLNSGFDAQTRPGWRDMDADGDLDLVVSISMVFDGASDNEFRPFWFENTGYQAAPPPNPYDHDGDGHVTTADLSLLLMEITD